MITIATAVYAKEEITLQDGTDVVLKPLVIARLRRFMKRWETMAKVATEDEGIDIFIDCCGIALEDNFKGKFDSLKAAPVKDEEVDELATVLSPEYREYLENTLEMDSIYKIIEICGGIKLNDPKLLEAAAAAVVEAGTA